jgi:hypothetical protein
MEPRNLADAGLTPAAIDIVSRYLAELESHLPAGRRVRKEILVEIADGLTCAIEEHLRAGQSAEAAARAAMAEFGDSRMVAVAFSRQLAATAAHRLGAGLVLTGPLVGLTWVAAFATAGLNWSSQIVNVLSAMPQYPLILAVTVPAAIVAITGSGWAARHLVVPPRVVAGAAIVAAIGCVAGDLSLLSTAVLGRNLIAAGPASLIALAIAASVIRLSAAGWAGRRIGRLRAGVN